MLMKRYSWIAGAFLIVILLVVAEMAIITKASGHELTEGVVFAKVPIERNTVITENMLELREIDREYAHPGAVKSIDEAVSKRAVINVEAGEMMLSAKLTAENAKAIEVTDKNNRLFSIRFEVDQANGWQLTEDQLVDIIYVPNYPEREQAEGKEQSGADNLIIPDGVTVLKNIRIAKIIDEYGRPSAASKADNVPKHISFEVTGQQAAFLAYAKRNGRLEIACMPD